MIDIEKAKEEFLKYTNTYDLNNNSIQRKVEHSLRVMEESKYIAESLKLSKEEIQLAELIGLLHDIGRFEQLKQSNSFADNNLIDHAILGNEILFNQNMIKIFIDDRSYDKIISKAILNHNKLNIEDELSENELLHAKIIRDADKTDNFRVKAEEKIEDIMDNCTKEQLENSLISDEIYNDFMNDKIIISSKRKTFLDFWISYIAFIFDFNFKYGLEYIMEKDYINTIIDRLNYINPNSIQKMKKIKEHALRYISIRK